MKKLTVMLQDSELEKYKRMFEAACSALGEVSDLLGIDPNEGGAEPIIEEINKLKAQIEAAQVQGAPLALIVLDEDGMPIHCAPTNSMAQEHINDAINDFDIQEAAKWVVREAFTAPPKRQPLEKFVRENLAASAFAEAMAFGFSEDNFIRHSHAVEAAINGGGAR